MRVEEKPNAGGSTLDTLNSLLASAKPSDKRTHSPPPLAGNDDDDSATKEKPAKRSRRRRQGLSRRSSEQRLGGADEELEDASTVTRKSCRRTEAITFLDLVNREMAGATPANKPKKGILRKGPSPMRKRVRYATNDATKKVWTLVRTYRKEPKSRHDQIWWTSDELEVRSEKDEKMATQWEDQYSQVLQQAYDSIEEFTERDDDDDEEPEQELDSSTFNQQVYSCEPARGLETDCFYGISSMVKSHRKKVLTAQDVIKEERTKRSSKKMSDFEIKLISQQSLKVSKKSALMARQMGEFDEHVLTRMET